MIVRLISEGARPVPPDLRRATRRSLDAWLATTPNGPLVVDEGDPRGEKADWGLFLREPEAMVPPRPLERAIRAMRGREGGLAPEGFFQGGAAPSEPYAAVWQFEQEAARRHSPGGQSCELGIQSPVELRRRGETGIRPVPVPGWVVHSFSRRRSWERAELLPLVPPSARTALEIGCGEGVFGALLEARGVRVTGIEPDRAAAALARRRLSRLLEATLETALVEIRSERFDVLVMADVLEHLEDPVGALRRLRQFLPPRGALVLSLPNASHASILAGVMQGRWDRALEGTVSDDHRTYAGKRGWDRLLRAGGFSVEEWRPSPVPIPSLEPWLPVLSGTGLSAEELSAVQWLAVARPSATESGLELASHRTDTGSGFDPDDPVGGIRGALSLRSEVRVRLPNPVAAACILPLMSGEIVAGEGRSALVDGFTHSGLLTRFLGSGIAADVEPRDVRVLPAPLGRLLEEAVRRGLPATPEALMGTFLDVRFRREET